MKQGNKVAVISFVPIGTVAAEAIRQAEAQQPELQVAHYDIQMCWKYDYIPDKDA